MLADGAQSAYILARDDAYGNGLAEVLEEVLDGRPASRCSTRSSTTRLPRASTPRSTTSRPPTRTRSSSIGFDESSKILRTMVEQGIGPGDKLVYGSDGNMGNALGEDFDAGT